MKPKPAAVLNTPVNDSVLTLEEQRAELLKCAASPSYFINTYVKIFDPEIKQWVPFELWPFQEECLELMRWVSEFLGLKSRQVGMTWLALAYGLWLMLFASIAEVLLFSKREDEAIYLLSDERLRGMYNHLPEWMKAKSIIVDDKKHFRLSNGSGARAFPSNAGDSYTATYAVVDEADLLASSDLSSLLGRVAPTVEAGGQLVVISRPDKSKPNSHFKQLYKDAIAGKNTWTAVFIPWHAHPGRDEDWYTKQKSNYRLDDLHEQYPATEGEALSARTSDKLLEDTWVTQCYTQKKPIPSEDLPPDAPAISGLCIYVLPETGRSYVIGVDPAEGKENSDDSSAVVMDQETGEEVAHLSGKIYMTVLAGYINQLGIWYNDAAVLYERNNHGHACLVWMRDHSRLPLLKGDDNDEGWQTNSKSKHVMYSDTAAELKAGLLRINNPTTYFQLVSIERSTLRAPSQMHDDAATAFALALLARRRNVATESFFFQMKVKGRS